MYILDTVYGFRCFCLHSFNGLGREMPHCFDSILFRFINQNADKGCELLR